MRNLRRLAIACLVATLGTGLGCATAKAPPPGDPLRPPAQKVQAVVASQDHVAVVTGPLEQAQEDCDPMSPDQGPPPKKVDGKDSKEAEKIASEGLHNLIAAEKQDKPYAEVTTLIEQSVGQFHQSLALDPQNVKATYNLSAAYARIGRNQCAVNLIARLVAMNRLGERKKDVGDAFERIWGSGAGRWKGKADPDFDHLRNDKRLTDLVPQPK